MKKLMLLLSSLWLISSCTPKPQPIEYGSDMCDFCRMSIVDAQYAAELVTTKAKVYKFDAIECMIGFSKEHQHTSPAHILVNTYHSPSELFNATESYFLISEKLPSPMGANLTAFKNQDEAKKMLVVKGGNIYNWQELQAFFGKDKLSMD